MKASEQKIQLQDNENQNYSTSKSTDTNNNYATNHRPHHSSSLKTFATNKTSSFNLNTISNIDSSTTKRCLPAIDVCKNVNSTSTLPRKKSILPYRIYKPYHAKAKYINEITKPSKNKNGSSSLMKHMQSYPFGANDTPKPHHKRPSLSLSLDFGNSNNDNNRLKASQLISKHCSPYPNERQADTAATANSSLTFLVTPLATLSTSTFPLLAGQKQNHEIKSEPYYCLPILTSCLPVSATSLSLAEK